MKNFLFFVLVLFLLPVSMKAQQDTSRSQKDSTNTTLRQTDNAVIRQPQPDLIQIEANELPDAVLKTLEKPKYNGWKNSVIFKNQSSNEYMITIGEPEKSVTYRFNEKGEIVKKDKDE